MLLLQQPEQACQVREIAPLTCTQPGTLHKELSKLADAGMLNRRGTVKVCGGVWFYGQWQSQSAQ